MRKRTIVSIFLLVAIIVVDQLVKVWVKTSFCLHERLDVFSWFEIYFTENQGMAFGMEFVGTMVLTLFRVLAIGFFSYYLYRLIRREASMAVVVSLTMVIAGALGNVIDNCFYGLIFTESPEAFFFQSPARIVPFGEGYGSFLSGRVVDMFYFPLWRWPEWMPLLGGQMFFNAVFNVADAAITCGAIALLILYYRHAWQEHKQQKALAQTADEQVQ